MLIKKTLVCRFPNGATIYVHGEEPLNKLEGAKMAKKIVKAKGGKKAAKGKKK